MPDQLPEKPLACIILAAGTGSRMKSALPKPLHELAGRPMIDWLLETVESLSPEKIIIVSGPDKTAWENALKQHEVVVQEKPLGTGDAVKSALPALEDFTGDVLILLGDMPLIKPETLVSLIQGCAKTSMTVLGVHFDEPPAFGRLVLHENGALAKIVEDKDCTAEERCIKLCNTGAFCVSAEKLAGWVKKIGNDNAQGEYYITDLVAIANTDGATVHTEQVTNNDEVRGVNSRKDLAALEQIVQQGLRSKAMENGATLLAPHSVYFSWDTKLGQDVLIEPNVFFGPGVTIADHVHIKAFSHIEGATIKKGATIGPMARLRPGSDIGAGSKIGNFVEIKNAILGQGVKASHLAYIGDAAVGDDVNFSCGAITVNYDGFDKHKTIIGAKAMIGSNVNLVAPVTIGTGAFVAAGSTITKDVPADALAVAREKPMIKEGWATQRRKKRTG